MFVDTHAHLTDKQFNQDIEEVIKKTEELGVKYVITSGFNLTSSLQAVEFAKNHKNVFASIGIYPEYANTLNDKILQELKDLARDEKVVAIGEIGLQFTSGAENKTEQENAFVKQLELAYSLKKPIVVHCRDAMGKMIELLKDNKEKLLYGGTMHCFNGSKESAMEILNLGLHISVGGVSTFKNASNLKEVLKFLPIEKILLETDCPYLAPSPFRGKRNAPFYIPTIAENLAIIKNLSIEKVAEITFQNAVNLFKLEKN